MSRKDLFYKLTPGPILVRSMPGPDNNIYLDQILSQVRWPFRRHFTKNLPKEKPQNKENEKKKK